MVLNKFEEICKYYEILAIIYKQLTFEDQLKLSRVSDSLKCFFETYILKEKYRSLTIMAHQKFNYVVTNESGINRRCLNPREFQEFLSSYANDVEELQLISPYLEMEIFQIVKMEDQLDISKFPKLRKLYVARMILTNDYLELLSQVCTQLKSLNLKHCFTNSEKPLEIKTSFEKMRNLKELRLKHMALPYTIIKMDYNTFGEVMTKLKLESLRLNVTIESNQEIQQFQMAKCLPLKELHITTACNSQSSLLNISKCLMKCEMLTSLKLQIIDVVTDELLQTLAEACKNLQSLTIRKTLFKNITLFTLPSKVCELALHTCKGLNFESLQKFLTSQQLTKFSSRQTDYEEECDENFTLSSFVQTLALDCNYMYRLRNIFGSNNSNLKELEWYHARYGTIEKFLKTNAPNEDPMALNSLLQLKSLQKLTIPQPSGYLKWSSIIALLNHSPLIEFTIGNQCFTTTTEPLDVPTDGFSTNIKRLTIPLNIFAMALDFWLDLFQQNVTLATICCTFTFLDFDYDDLLRRLIDHKSFTLQTLDVFGYTINCKELEINFGKTIQKLDNTNCEDLFRIILSKS